MTSYAANGFSQSMFTALRPRFSVFAGIKRRIAAARDEAALAKLDDHMLRDIGLSAGDVYRPDPQRLREVLTRRCPW